MSLRAGLMEPDTRRWKGLIRANAVATIGVKGRRRIVLPRTTLTLVPVTRTGTGFHCAVVARISIGNRYPGDAQCSDDSGHKYGSLKNAHSTDLSGHDSLLLEAAIRLRASGWPDAFRVRYSPQPTFGGTNGIRGSRRQICE